MASSTHFVIVRAPLPMAEVLRVVLREQARGDVRDAVDWYRSNADANVAVAFVDALETGLYLLAQRPGIGSPRYATELDLPGLMSWLLDGFPYVVFFVEQGDLLDVWRVLHARRDIPDSLQVSPIVGTPRSPPTVR